MSRQTLGGAIAHVLRDLPDGIAATDPDIIAGYARDMSRFTPAGTPAAVVSPRTTEEVAVCLAAANRHQVPVVPRGAGSGLSGGANAVDGAIVLSTHRMHKILDLDPADRFAVAQPGVVTAAIRRHAAAASLHYPPDPGSVEFSTLGGNVATNAGGICCVKYGVTGDFVLGLEVVLADGRIMRTGRRTVKGVAGYDLTRLFVGSEGTLGVITEITVRLVPRPRPAHTLVTTFATLTHAGDAVRAIAADGVPLSMIEILDRTTVQAVEATTRMGLDADTAALLLIQSTDTDAHEVLATVERICTDNHATEIATSADPVEADMLLEVRRQALPALERLGDWLLDDVAVPCSRITDLITAAEGIAADLGLTIGVFGHAGDGNLHPTIIFDDADPTKRSAARRAFDAITEQALRLGGTITGEHGIGRLKSGWLGAEHSPVAMDVQRALKAALDPGNTLNPGAVLDRHRTVDRG